jgi:hypothetical protein
MTKNGLVYILDDFFQTHLVTLPTFQFLDKGNEFKLCFEPGSLRSISRPEQVEAAEWRTDE